MFQIIIYFNLKMKSSSIAIFMLLSGADAIKVGHRHHHHHAKKHHNQNLAQQKHKYSEDVMSFD